MLLLLERLMLDHKHFMEQKLVLLSKYRDKNNNG